MFEPILSFIAIGLIFYLAWLGIFFGVFQELSNTLWLFFTMMVTLRYWWPVTDWLMANTSITGANAVIIAFWSVFLTVACVVILVLSRLMEKDAMAKYPKLLDSVLGGVFGFLSAVILISCMMLSVSVFMPKFWEPYERTGLVAQLDEIPIKMYRTVEGKWLGIGVKDPGHTLLPTLKKADVDDFKKYWQ
ncbi:MAG: CvpA family protein [Verrucomicrobiia bacterium]